MAKVEQKCSYCLQLWLRVFIEDIAVMLTTGELHWPAWCIHGCKCCPQTNLLQLNKKFQCIKTRKSAIIIPEGRNHHRNNRNALHASHQLSTKCITFLNTVKIIKSIGYIMCYIYYSQSNNSLLWTQVYIADQCLILRISLFQLVHCHGKHC